MITQPYKQLVLDGSLEVSPATFMENANAVQLTVVATEAVGSADVYVQQSNDAENWTLFGARTEVASPGFYVLPAQVGICTRYVRVACEPTNVDGIVMLAVTQHTMKL